MFERDTFSKPSFLVSMLDFGGVYNVHSNLNVDKLPGFNVYAGQLESKKAAPGALLQCL